MKIIKKIYFIVFCLILVLVASKEGIAAQPENAIASITRNNFLLFHTWNTPSDIVLGCAILAASPKSGPSDSKMVIFKDGKEIFSFIPHAAPLSMYSLSENDSRLITVWVNGSGVYLLNIFSFLDGKVTKVLEVTSKMLPEFAYSATTPGNYEQRIIISSMDWVIDQASGVSIQRPVKASLYIWDGRTYKLYKSVPWVDRLYEK